VDRLVQFGRAEHHFAAQFPALDARPAKQLRLLWISCGKEDGLLEGNQKLSSGST